MPEAWPSAVIPDAPLRVCHSQDSERLRSLQSQRVGGYDQRRAFRVTLARSPATMWREEPCMSSGAPDPAEETAAAVWAHTAAYLDAHEDDILGILGEGSELDKYRSDLHQDIRSNPHGFMCFVGPSSWDTEPPPLIAHAIAYAYQLHLAANSWLLRGYFGTDGNEADECRNWILVKIADSPAQYDPRRSEGSREGFMITIIQRRARDYLRWRKRAHRGESPLSGDVDPPSNDPPPDVVAMRNELAAQIEECSGQLKDPYRRAYELIKDDASNDEIAKVLNKTRSYARLIRKRTYESLRECLRKRIRRREHER